MRDHRSESGRRKVLKNITAATVGVSGLAGAVRAEDSSDPSGDISPQDLDVGFNPYNQDATAEFTKNLYELGDAGRERIETQLTDDQKRAVADMQQPATFIRTTISVTREHYETSAKTKINKSKVTKEEVNDDIADRWGWNRPAVKKSEKAPSLSDIAEFPTQDSVKTDSCSSDCPDRYSYYRNNTSFQHSVTGVTWAGQSAFNYEQDVSWDAPTCGEDGDGGNAGDSISKGVCRIDQDVRVTTDLAWAYKGEVEEEVDVAYDDTSFTSYTQGLLEGSTLNGLKFNANPVIEIKGTQAPPDGLVLSSDNGV